MVSSVGYWLQIKNVSFCYSSHQCFQAKPLFIRLNIHYLHNNYLSALPLSPPLKGFNLSDVKYAISKLNMNPGFDLIHPFPYLYKLQCSPSHHICFFPGSFPL